MNYFLKIIVPAVSLVFSLNCSLSYAENSEAIAKKLVNPLADMISVPFEYNYDHELGSEDNGISQYVKIQPVLPLHLSKSWDLISRPILPVLWDRNVVPQESFHGVGDLEIEEFFSPLAPNALDIRWGIGPYLSFPTATNDKLGSQQYLGGVVGVVLRQKDHWTVGLLTYQAWSYAKDNGGGNELYTDELYLEPFIDYVTTNAWTFSVNSESYLYWDAQPGSEWSVPINADISKLLNFGKLALSLKGGIRYWVANPPGQAQNFGARATITFVLPE